ncbi:MAG: mycothiol system anti-sigma-R factor [Bowdeniella nasicola]|nr:mycothiol system anti-sigma-R factor [Bowdeniella nasicola]
MRDDCSCEEAQRRLYELLDAELEGELLARLQTHVDQCDHCHEIVDVEAHIRAVLRRSCSESAPAALRARIVEVTIQRQTYWH